MMNNFHSFMPVSFPHSKTINKIHIMSQSLSDEDSFKKMSSTKEVLEKVEELLSSLVERCDLNIRSKCSIKRRRF